MTDLTIPQREVMWNVSSLGDQLALYGLLALTLVIFANGIWQRVKLWSSGAPDESRLQGWTRRVRLLWEYAFRQRGTNRERKPRLFLS